MLKCVILLIFLYLNRITNAAPSTLTGRAGEINCGYESCPAVSSESDIINVHLVPHTHDDVGWLKTIDQYYYGSRGGIQKASVQYILDTVVEGLLQDPARKFVFVESAFFFKWWNEQTEETQEQVKMLVNEGRLEFIGGAWSMNDEAAAHYHSLIDQFTWGLRLLNDTFGECGRPRIGWQIDPFGHSREQASLFTKMGYDGMFFARLDWRDKTQRRRDKTMEMLWKSSDSLDDSDLFTGVLFNHYSAPRGFCYDYLCNDEPIIDDIESPDYNVIERLTEFKKFVDDQASAYLTNNVILTMGDDFHYMSAQMWFKNLDKLIKYANERQDEFKMNVFYSTPSCYLKALHDTGIVFPTKTDDFFPYANDPHAYWTGYYTSRPSSKRFERIGNHFLQVCKQLSASAKIPEDSYEDHLGYLRRIMGVMQHHDAITGTEKQHVADDYHRELHSSIVHCRHNTKSSLNQFMTDMVPSNSSTSTEWELEFNSCLNLNISVCDVSENSEKFMVTVYNPLGHETNQYVRFPVNGDNYEVRDGENNIISTQLVYIPTPVIGIHYRDSKSTKELVFRAENVPAMGYKSYYVSRTTIPSTDPTPEEVGETTIGNEALSITFGPNGHLQLITIDGEIYKLDQDIVIYYGAAGNNAIFANRSSGAYIFRPDPEKNEYVLDQKVTLQVIRGDLVDEVHQTFNEWISQVVRVYKDQNYIEFEWLVGPIPVEDDIGKEIVSRFSTDIKSNEEFFTDSNGRQMIKRKRNFRETFQLTFEEPVASNYYPINSKIAIEDSTHRLAVLNDRAQGGASITDGSVELMVHRRLLQDDAFGVAEALNEMEHGKGQIARGKLWLIFGKKTNQHPTLEARERLLQNEVLLPNWLFFDDLKSMTANEWSNKYHNEHSIIGSSVPQNVYVMTLEPWKEGSKLIRFEHLLDIDEDNELSAQVTLNLTEVFPGEFFFSEVSLSANQWIEDLNRLQFNQQDATPFASSDSDIKKVKTQKALSDDELLITLKPMEIRTFIMTTSSAFRSQNISILFPLLALGVILKNYF